MEISQNIATNIKNLCRENDISVNKLLLACDINTSFITGLNQGKTPSIDKVLKIADYFNVSIDYLLFAEESFSNNNANNVSHSALVQGTNSGTVVVKNSETKERKLSKEEFEILRIYKDLDFKRRVKFLNIAIELEDELKNIK